MVFELGHILIDGDSGGGDLKPSAGEAGRRPPIRCKNGLRALADSDMYSDSFGLFVQTLGHD